MVIDESEISKTKYLNVPVGEKAAPEKTYVVNCSVVEFFNQAVIAARWMTPFETSVYSGTISCSFCVMPASYMTACTAALQTLYPHLFHVTCTTCLAQLCRKGVQLLCQCGQPHLHGRRQQLSRTGHCLTRLAVCQNQW